MPEPTPRFTAPPVPDHAPGGVETPRSSHDARNSRPRVPSLAPPDWMRDTETPMKTGFVESCLKQTMKMILQDSIPELASDRILTNLKSEIAAFESVVCHFKEETMETLAAKRKCVEDELQRLRDEVANVRYQASDPPTCSGTNWDGNACTYPADRTRNSTSSRDLDRCKDHAHLHINFGEEGFYGEVLFWKHWGLSLDKTRAKLIDESQKRLQNAMPADMGADLPEWDRKLLDEVMQGPERGLDASQGEHASSRVPAIIAKAAKTVASGVGDSSDAGGSSDFGDVVP